MQFPYQCDTHLLTVIIWVVTIYINSLVVIQKSTPCALASVASYKQAKLPVLSNFQQRTKKDPPALDLAS